MTYRKCPHPSGALAGARAIGQSDFPAGLITAGVVQVAGGPSRAGAALARSAARESRRAASSGAGLRDPQARTAGAGCLDAGQPGLRGLCQIITIKLSTFWHSPSRAGAPTTWGCFPIIRSISACCILAHVTDAQSFTPGEA